MIVDDVISKKIMKLSENSSDEWLILDIIVHVSAMIRHKNSNKRVGWRP